MNRRTKLNKGAHEHSKSLYLVPRALHFVGVTWAHLITSNHPRILDQMGVHGHKMKGSCPITQM